MPAVQHRPYRQRDGGNIDGRGRHQARRCGLVAADGEYHRIERIAVQDLDQAEIGQVAVEAGRRTLARLLDRMHRKLERDASRLADSRPHPLGEHDVMAVAGREVRAGLGDPDDGLARLQLLDRQAEVQVTLQIERRHVRVRGIVEPGP